MHVSISAQFLEYFSSITPNPKPMGVNDYTRAHLAEVTVHHLFQDLTTPTSQALLQIGIEFMLHKKSHMLQEAAVIQLRWLNFRSHNKAAPKL